MKGNFYFSRFIWNWKVLSCHCIRRKSVRKEYESNFYRVTDPVNQPEKKYGKKVSFKLFLHKFNKANLFILDEMSYVLFN